MIIDEDSASTKILKQALYLIPHISIKGAAISQQMLFAKLNRYDIDFILLDFKGEIGGVDIIDSIKKISPGTAIIIVYDPHLSDPYDIVKALEKGAFDCIEKPKAVKTRRFNEFRARLLPITGLFINRKTFSKTLIKTHKNKFFIPLSQTLETKNRVTLKVLENIEIIVVASSTGGPEILSQIVSLLPGTLAVPIILLQHMPAHMTNFFADSLNAKSELEIALARENDEIQPSRVYVAPGGKHIAVTKKDKNKRRFIRFNDKPPINSVRPSADELFKSVSDSYEDKILAVVLTGMGEDGKKGIEYMKKKGGICLSQSKESCTVYGMPRAVDEAGLSDECLDPLSITQRIVQAAGEDT